MAFICFKLVYNSPLNSDNLDNLSHIILMSKITILVLLFVIFVLVISIINTKQVFSKNEKFYLDNIKDILKVTDYAVFIHKGTPQDFPKTFAYIFENWIPNSKYKVDSREHFELIPETYRPDDSNAKEEVWIPILEKT